MKARNKRVLTIIGAIAAAVCAVVLVVKLLKPRGEQSVDRKAILIPLLYRTIGREKTYRLIARGEYSAAKKYERLLSYPEVRRIQADENRHGDMVLALIGEKA